MDKLMTAAPTAEIELFGETLILKYGFRAYQEMGFNPFDMASIAEFEARPKDCRALAAQVRAGLLHLYYGKNAPRKGQEPPTVDDVMDELDPVKFAEIWLAITKAIGVDKDKDATEEKKPADPPQA